MNLVSLNIFIRNIFEKAHSFEIKKRKVEKKRNLK